MIKLQTRGLRTGVQSGAAEWQVGDITMNDRTPAESLSDRLELTADLAGGEVRTMKPGEVDDQVTYAQHLQEDDSPVVHINQFNLVPRRRCAFRRGGADDAAFMKQQPAFLSTQLRRGIAGSTTLITVPDWESARALSIAFHSPELQARAARYPDDIIAPHMCSQRSPCRAAA